MSVQFTSLAAVTSTGAGAALRLYGHRGMHSMQVTFTGSPTGVKVNIEGRIDGANYATIGTFDTAAGNVSGDIVSVTNANIDDIRANLVTLSGGAAPTVTASIVSTKNNE